MKDLSSEQKEIIITKFAVIKTIDELAELLNLIYTFLFPNAKPSKKSKIIHFQARTLNYLAFSKEKRYNEFQIPKKKTGEFRTISAPIYTLKTIQRCLNAILNCIFTPHKAANGFVEDKSILTNAAKHVAKNFVYNIDLEGFFPNTNFRRIKTVLGLEPFSLIGEREELGFIIANLCCENGCLPQGAPTSPTLTNAVCQRLDRKLYKLAKQNSANYTRYADDITFSSNRPIFTIEFKNEINKIVKEENYAINLSKERLQDKIVRQEVTGVIVNQKLNVTRQYIRELDLRLKIWKKYGYSEANSKFEEQYRNSNGFLRNKGKIPPMESVLWGKIQFLGMIRGHNDTTYQRYCDIYKNDCLAKSTPSGIVPTKSLDLSDLQKLLNIWEQNGLDKAINLT